MDHELVAQLALELIPGVGARGAKQLIGYCGSPEDVFDSSKKQLLKIPGVGIKMAETIKSYQPLNEAESVLAQCETAGIEVLNAQNEKFPKRLNQIHDSPNILYSKGNGSPNYDKIVAIVGTRRATQYGKDVTSQIVNDLAYLDVAIVSGLAYGIDIQAHRIALQKGLPTFAVLAGGIDRLYPSSHKKYASEMQMNGALLSESMPGTKPDAHLFPVRNRIIAGITDATIVVEAAEKGGALITAHLADTYNKPVFAVPGNIDNEYSVGTNRLIATQKAFIYSGIEDLIYHLGWDISEPKNPPPLNLDLSDDEQILFDLLVDSASPIEIDLLALQAKIPINKVASSLLSLEFKNLVKSLPGKKYSPNN